MELFPLPEPPSELVAQVLDNLRGARRELRDAGRIVHLIGVTDSGSGRLSEHDRTRVAIENATAERRCELWAAEVRRLEDKARGLGLDVASAL